MKMAAESTSFIQFDYCNLCKLSHKKQKKHLYSKRHQEILQNILKKFSKKVKDAKACINNPQIETLGWENGAQFWCYFCEVEVDKHRRETDATVKHGGLLQHIASNEHVKKTGEFFWKNIIDKKKKTNYTLSETDAERFGNKSETALTLYRQKMKTRIQQIADKIRKQTSYQDEFVKMNVITEPPWSQMCTKQTQISQHATPNQVTPMRAVSNDTRGVSNNTRGVPRRKTVQAVATGLTSIVKPKSQPASGDESTEVVGNVFTGAMPPWLMEEEDHAGTGEIGPSLKEYDKHLDREKKKKLPANRVGAKFDHTLPTSATWMPSFGGVWNQGRRLNSKIQFDKRAGIKGQNSRFDTSQPSARSSTPSIVIPYKRKNKSETTSTVIGIQLISSPLVEPRASDAAPVNPWNSHHQQSVSTYPSPANATGFQAIMPRFPTPLPSVISPYLTEHSIPDGVQSSRSAPCLQSELALTKSTDSDSVGKMDIISSVSPRVMTSVSVSAAHIPMNKSKSDTNMNQGSEIFKQTNGSTVSNLASNESVVHEKTVIASDKTAVVKQSTRSVPGENIRAVKSDNKTDTNIIQTKRPSAPCTQPENVVPYKRKKKHVQTSETRLSDNSRSSPGTDVGQMFTQACDLSFRQQSQGRESYQTYHTPQSFHSNQNIYQQNQNQFYPTDRHQNLLKLTPKPTSILTLAIDI